MHQKYTRTVGYGYDKLVEQYGYNNLKSLKIYNKIKSKEKYNFIKKYFLNNKKEQSILEIGPGLGLFLKFVLKKNIDYTGIESSKKFFFFLRKKFKDKKFTFLNLCFPLNLNKIKKKFQIIFSLNSIQERNFKNSCSKKFIKDFVNGCFKLLKSNKKKEGEGRVGGGGVLIFDFFIKGKVDYYEDHLNYYSKKEIINFFKKKYTIKFYNVVNSKYETICVMKLK